MNLLPPSTATKIMARYRKIHRECEHSNSIHTSQKTRRVSNTNTDRLEPFKEDFDFILRAIRNIFIMRVKCGFISEIAKLRKANISYMFVRPSVRMEQLGSHWTDFHKVLYLSILRKFVEEIQVSLIPPKNNRYSTCKHFHIYDNISLN
jgi:hypothetical protein